MFTIDHVDPAGGRAGSLRTSRGDIPTPAFMPVATRAAVRTLDSMDLQRTRADIIISNAFLLHLRPGNDILDVAEGIHGFMNWKGGIFTDSGGFQMIRKGFLHKITDDRIILRSPYDGQRISISPEDVVEWMSQQKPDVGMVLDDLPPHGSDHQRQILSVKRTVTWAQRSKKRYEELGIQGRTALFAILQGGTDPGLRERCIKEITDLDFQGYGIGGLSIGESRDEMLSIVDLTTNLLPVEKPVYLMGVGSPLELLDCIAKGIDVFDSVFPARNARHHSVMTRTGRYSIKSSNNAGEPGPLEPGCFCPTCREHTRTYIHHLVKTGEFGWMRLVSMHNLFFIQKLMQDSRTAIMEDRLGSFINEFRRDYQGEPNP